MNPSMLIRNTVINKMFLRVSVKNQNCLAAHG